MALASRDYSQTRAAVTRVALATRRTSVVRVLTAVTDLMFT